MSTNQEELQLIPDRTGAKTSDNMARIEEWAKKRIEQAEEAERQALRLRFLLMGS